jgi:PPOX class probable F420-dependent enzyme
MTRMSSTSTALANEKFVSLTTFKKDGDGVAGPMWIAGDGDRLAIWTPADSWKVKRARRDPRVTLVPCTRSGKTDAAATPVEGTAEIVDDPAVVSRVQDAFKQKYGLMYRFVTLIERIAARGAKPRVVLRITLS